MVLRCSNISSRSISSLSSSRTLMSPSSVSMHIQRYESSPQGRLALVFVLMGQALRSAAMIHASTSFSHQVAFRKLRSHTLVTDGVYAYVALLKYHRLEMITAEFALDGSDTHPTQGSSIGHWARNYFSKTPSTLYCSPSSSGDSSTIVSNVRNPYCA